MYRDEIINKILKVIQNEVFFGKMPPLDFNEPLGEEGVGIDSLNFLKLLTVLEKEFNMKIEDDYWDYNSLKTVNLITDYFHNMEN